MKILDFINKTDNNIKYEELNLVQKILNLVRIPLMNNIPNKALSLFRKTHKSADKVVEHKTSYFALDILYQCGKTYKSNNFVESIFRKIWFNTNNAIAVRNRLKFVTESLKNYIQHLKDGGTKEISILSIASGSARAIIDSVAHFEKDNLIFNIIFLDKDEGAHIYSKSLSKNLSDKNNLRWIKSTVGDFFKNNEDKFDIIEMVGLLDYFDDQKAVSVFKEIKQHLRYGGYFVTANISDNTERPFVTNFIGWDMIYRSDKSLKKLLIESGFNKNGVGVIYEPLRVHTVACVFNT